MFNNGNQIPSTGNKKTAHQIIIDLQDKNAKLRHGLGKLIQICENTKMQKESEVWMQTIGFAKQMFNETDPFNK
jgi:Holliday junction resolvasome RuvABC DNA-binding subunit